MTFIPDARARELMEPLKDEIAVWGGFSIRAGFHDSPKVKAILSAEASLQTHLVITCMERHIEAFTTPGNGTSTWYAPVTTYCALIEKMLRKKLPFEEDALLCALAMLSDSVNLFWMPYLSRIMDACRNFIGDAEPSDAMKVAIKRFADSFRTKEELGDNEEILRFLAKNKHLYNAPAMKFVLELEALQGRARPMLLLPGEAWSDRAIADLKALDPPLHKKWEAFLFHCCEAKGAAPSAKWSKLARAHVAGIGHERFLETVREWFALVDKPRTAIISDGWSPMYEPDPNQMILDTHTNILKGLVWCFEGRDDAETARLIGTLGASAYRKIPLRGPRCAALGNACVHVLGGMGGVLGIGQLAVLKRKAKSIPIQNIIEKAFVAAATKAGIPRDEVEELGTPTFGFEEVGVRTESLDDVTGELRITGTSSAELRWLKSDGSTMKSPPAGIAKKFAEEIKELKAAQKDVVKLLPALRDRLDSSYIEERSWTPAAWRERQIDHPLAGTFARRLIWEWEVDGKTVACAWLDGRLVDSSDAEVASPDDGAAIRLWHPINKPVAEVMAWREWLERHSIRQPFKQAHREIYVLTDAERRTATYSNRFAAHILRQHQFNALARGRGWRSKLALIYEEEDESNATSRILRARGLQAEFWTQATGEEATGSGAFQNVATDQVRFHNINTAGTGPEGDPVPLDRIPSLTFSEVMRDVDLFVGVASVGNDPQWRDGGPGGHHRDYWERYTSAALTASAEIRRQVLEGLIPRLRIAARCSINERHLVVRGDLRTYSIHLGSGNITMEPGNQYLCIVAEPSKSETGGGKVFLPFEGDGMLSIILSKAFLLAADGKIKDPTITRQIKQEV